MKRNAVIALGVCCVCLLHGQYGRAQAKTKEKLSGIFSIGENMKVCFSPGNLQYNAAEGTHRCADGTTKQGTWRFAERQWDIVGMGYGQTDENSHNYIGGTVEGSDNRQVDSSYDGWIDLFGWGTSGWNSGAKAYEPWATSTDYEDYYPGNSPSNNLTGEYAYADWGIYNQIGDDAPGTWRTLTHVEWKYLIETRTDARLKYGAAKVNGMTGLVLLPDEWTLPEGCGFTPGMINTTDKYDWSGVAPSNRYTLPQWRMMEAAGAVFLPCAGGRRTSVAGTGADGYIWTSTAGNDKKSYRFFFQSNFVNVALGNYSRENGRSVRLVKDMSSTVSAYQPLPFSVASGKTVYFSPGNLQYNAVEGTHRCADGTTKQGTWRFAERQWDIVGMGYGQTDENSHNYIGGTVMNSDNRQADCSYDGWIDLFGWGTSGWNSGAKAYEPWSLSSEDADYYPGNSPSNNLTGEYVYADWGIYNQIGDDAPGTWRTLTKHEWDYLFQKRPNAKSKWGTAKVNGMTGLVVLPDEWALPEGCGFTAGLTDAEEWYDWSEVAPSNLYTLAQWRMMEAAGAVFLPCAGYRYGITVYRTGSYGNYWSSTSGSRTPYTLRFYSNIIYPSGTIGYNYGASVRLVSEHIQHSQTRYETVYDTICYQPVYTYWGQEYTLPPGENVADGYANYYFEYEDQSEDVVYQLYLAVALPVPETILPDKYLCEGDAYQWLDGGYYTTNQTLTYTLQSRKTGCDSIVTLRLLAAPAYHVQFADTVLQGATYYWRDKYLSEEGVYEEHLTTAVYGCDSVLTLHLHTNKVKISEVTIADQCADDGSLNIAWQGEGVTDAVRVTVSRLQPQAQTYETVRIAVDENTRTATIPFAERAGYYQAQTDFLYKGQTAHTRTVPFTRLYPSSVLEQAWNDVIAVLTHDYNGGYDFIAFEWLKDGQPIAGEKRPYLYEPLVMGAAYSAILTEEDGTRLECCPIIVTPHTDDVRVYPVIANPSRQVNCHVSEPSEMTIYDAAGRLVLTQSLVTGDNIFSGPGVQGTYLMRVCMTQNGRIRTLKLVVQ